MRTHESEENYLETILLLKKEIGVVRSIDIAHALEYSKPSVSRAVGLLKEKGYIVVDSNGYISLTNDGEQTAKNILERHNLIMTFLKNIGVSEQTAENDACRIEHVISSETFEKLKEFVLK